MQLANNIARGTHGNAGALFPTRTSVYTCTLRLLPAPCYPTGIPVDLEGAVDRFKQFPFVVAWKGLMADKLVASLSDAILVAQPLVDQIVKPVSRPRITNVCLGSCLVPCCCRLASFASLADAFIMCGRRPPQQSRAVFSRRDWTLWP